MSDARAGLAAAAEQLAHTTRDGRDYYADPQRAADGADDLFLLPPFDEFLVAYRDRTAVLDPAHADKVVPGANGIFNPIFNPIVVVGGRVVGTWRRELKPGRVALSVSGFGELGTLDPEELEAVGARYGRFLGAQPAW